MAFIPSPRLALVALLVLSAPAARAAADCVDAPCPGGDAPRYRVSLEGAFHHAGRDDFARPVFLFPVLPRRVEARELRTTLGVDIELTTALSLRADLPLSTRWVDVVLPPVVVSPDERLPGSERALSGVGLADPTLAASYRLIHHRRFEGHLALGLRVPIDDNPGSTTFPRRVPTSTGQGETFAEAITALSGDTLDLSLRYRLSLFPGNAATYLVRRIGNQSYTSGSLAYFFRHRVELSARVHLSGPLALTLTPDWEVREQPRLLERGGERAFLPEARLHELGLRVGLLLRLDPQNELTLSYRELFLDSWQKDPFFPIEVPERGVSLFWRLWSR